MDLDYQCVCGHMYDEHEGQFFLVCTIEDCNCEDYEDVDDDDDE